MSAMRLTGPTAVFCALAMPALGQSAPAASPPPAAGTAAPAAAPARRPACAGVLHRQGDFWAGLWEVTGEKGRFLGINRVVVVDGGCALQETWSSGRGSYTGRSLNRVGSDGRWQQTWVDSGGQPLELSGGLSGSSMVLEGETPGTGPKAPATRQRITWTPEADGTVRQLWESSRDGGKTYSVAFDGRYRRIAQSAAPRGGFLERAGGEWIGSGAILETPANVELSIRPMLLKRKSSAPAR